MVPPSIAGFDGNPAVGEPGKIFTADRSGSIQEWKLTLLGLEQGGTYTPGDQLPADVLGIWDLDVLPDGSVMALATYAEGGTEWYGFLKGINQGESWSWVKPAAMRDPHFQSLEGHSAVIENWQVDFTGNFWRVALYEMTWLEDGLHGWAWGRKGVVRTTDGGETWSVAYKAAYETDEGISTYKPVWGVAFHTPDSGVAVIGGPVGSEYHITTDGGVTWTSTKSLAVNRLADLEYVNGEYRALVFNRTQRQKNTLMQVSTNGKVWNSQPGLGSKVLNESVYASEFVWANSSTGFFIQRQGEIWITEDGGVVWEELMKNDPSYDTVFYGDGTSIAGNFTPPYFPYAGYGQRTVLIRDDVGDPYLVNVITDTCTGQIRPYIAVWYTGAIASVHEKSELSTFNLQAAPNPVAKDLELRFTLQKPGHIHASVVNVRGQIVKRVDLGRLEAGEQVRNLVLDDLSEGVYQIIIRSGNEQDHQAIIIER